MYVQVRMMESGRSVTILTSRMTGIGEFKKLVEEKFNIKPENQRLLYSGKQLENQYRLFDYDININNVIQLIVRAHSIKNNTPETSASEVTNNLKIETPTPSCSFATSSTLDKDNLEDVSEESKYFQIGDCVDVKDYRYGSWFIGKLIKIKKDISPINKPNDSKSPVQNDGLVYVVEVIGCPEEPVIEVQLQEIRPHAYEILPFEKLKIGHKVLMNYNVEYPQERGFWFDVQVKKIKTNRKGREVIGVVSVGLNEAVLNNCHLMFLNDIYIIKPYKLVAERTPEDNAIMQSQPPVIRAGPLHCIKCKDNMEKSCKNCGCRICGGKDNEDKQLMCDECDHSYHMACLTPLLKVVPADDDWYCPSCKNDEDEIVKAGGKLKALKKKTPQSTSASKRDWGKVMACVGKTKKCTIVPSNHFGPIPGVEVGTTWLFRIQVFKAGIHRTLVGGIHGHDNQGAFSIVLSGSHEDDVDNGDEILYSGSGGQGCSSNKRTALQNCDQKLTRYNRALALNCNADIDNKKGAKSVDWKNGKPVRVVRSYKLKKHSKYAPELGNRYDGIYKVIKYYPERGNSGFIKWRFVLRRDDPTPAPWTVQGKKRMAQLDLKMISPENYIPIAVTNKTKQLVSKRKRTLQDADIEDNEQNKNNESENISLEIVDSKDSPDKKVFLDRVEETFLCTSNQEMVFEPMTIECSHNIYKNKKLVSSLKTSKTKKLAVSDNTEIYPNRLDGRQISPVRILDYKMLNVGKFVNDILIEYYLNYCFMRQISKEDRARSFVFNTFFYTALAKEFQPPESVRLEELSVEDRIKMRHDRVKKWTKHENVFEKDFIFVPINENFHWFMVVICHPGLTDPCLMEDGTPLTIPQFPSKPVHFPCASINHERDECDGNTEDLLNFNINYNEQIGEDYTTDVENLKKRNTPAIKQPCILVFDSLYNDNGTSRAKVVATLREWLIGEYRATYNSMDRDFSSKSMWGGSVKLPQQPNFTDCGLYVMHYFEQFFMSPIVDYSFPITHLENWFDDDDVSYNCKKRREVQQILIDMIEERTREGHHRITLPELNFIPKFNNTSSIPTSHPSHPNHPNHPNHLIYLQRLATKRRNNY